jgi:hypothetical protein
MKRMKKIPIQKAKGMKREVKRKAEKLEEYKRYINSLTSEEAGEFGIKDEKEGFAIRAGLKRAAEALDVRVKIQKRGNNLYVWRE